jgi:hypothetical protein
VQKTAAERLQALEHPAIDVLARFLTAPEQATTFSAMLHPSTVLNAAKIVLDRAGKTKIGKPPDDTLIDVTKLSTPLLRMLQAELRQIEHRQSQAVAALVPWIEIGYLLQNDASPIC